MILQIKVVGMAPFTHVHLVYILSVLKVKGTLGNEEFMWFSL